MATESKTTMPKKPVPMSEVNSDALRRKSGAEALPRLGQQLLFDGGDA